MIARVFMFLSSTVKPLFWFNNIFFSASRQAAGLLFCTLQSPSPLALPHAGSHAVLLGAYGVGVDRRGFDAAVAQPLAEHVERHTGVDRVHGKAVAQSQGALVRAVFDACR